MVSVWWGTGDGGVDVPRLTVGSTSLVVRDAVFGEVCG